MRPEYRSKVDEKYYKKIEQIVRRPEKRKDGEEGGGDGEEGCSPCPGCGNAVAESCLDCGECKILIPYCIATVCYFEGVIFAADLDKLTGLKTY